MGGTRLGTKPPALFLLAVAILAAAEAFLAFRSSQAAIGSADDRITAFVLLAVLMAGAVACLVAALRLWNAPKPTVARATALFGRNADPGPSGGPRLRLSLLGLPLVVLAAAIVNHAVPWATSPPGAVERPAPVEPTSPETVAAPSPPPEQTIMPPPAESAPAEPPVTVAPLPEPPKLATAAEGHHDAVVWLDVAPDGRSLLSASTDRMIKLWDIDGKRLVRDLGVHKDMARVALFMPDGKTALTAGDDGEIVLRTLADGSVPRVFAAGKNGGVRKLAISPDGRLAVAGYDSNNIVVWDIETGKALHVLTGHQWSISSVAVSPDGKRALTSDIDGELRLWDIGAGRLLRRWKGHERGAYGAVFTADGRHAVTGSGDTTIKLWDLDTFKEVRRFDGHSGTVYALALSPDGKRLASGSLDGSARLWDMATGNEIARFDPGTGPIYSVAFAPDGSLLTGGVDRAIRRWPPKGPNGALLFAGAPEN